jgi:hypothetical protein
VSRQRRPLHVEGGGQLRSACAKYGDLPAFSWLNEQGGTQTGCGLKTKEGRARRGCLLLPERQGEVSGHLDGMYFPSTRQSELIADY